VTVDARRIDEIRRTLEEGSPHLGSETEGIVTDPVTLDVVHRIGADQPTQAIKRWVAAGGGPGAAGAASSLSPDVPETTVEANPPPHRSPRSSAAAQRLLAILIDTGLQDLTDGAQLLHGAAWRPPRITAADASEAAEPFKRLYYRFQIGLHGDKVGAAAGDHLNLSAPWLGPLGSAEISRKMIEMTGRMRLVGGALGIALTASSPLYFGADGARPVPGYGTALTPWESARLGHVWPGRTIMDVSSLYRDPVSFRRTMQRFAETGTLLSGRDVWLLARAQPGAVASGPDFHELCDDLGVDLSGGLERASELLTASFRYGPADHDNPLAADPDWQAVERWRQERLQAVIRAPRNRTEVRALETPPAFAADSPGGGYETPYEYVRSVHTFLEVLFIHLSENPPLVEDLEYGEWELQAAKSNEQAVLQAGLDARVHWIPRNMRPVGARELLTAVLDEIEPLAAALDRAEDLALVREVARGAVLPPAARIRAEIGHWYGIDPGLRHNAQLLPDDSYPKALLERCRATMEAELGQIEADLPTLPVLDRPALRSLLDLVRRRRQA